MSNLSRVKYNLSGAKRMEIDCSLCTCCNNACTFCFQREWGGYGNTEFITKEDIVSMANDTKEIFMSPRAQEVDDIVFKMMGGELFKFPPEHEIWDYYRLFFKTALKNAEEADVDISFNIITNLLYPRRHLDAVFVLADELNAIKPHAVISIGTSYDVWGRFANPARVELWKSNFDALLEYKEKAGIDVGVEWVLTRTAFDIIKNKDPKYARELEIFEWLYKKCQAGVIGFDYNRYEEQAKTTHNMHLTDVEYADACKWFLKNYPDFDTPTNLRKREKARVCSGGMDGWLNGKPAETTCTQYMLMILQYMFPNRPLDELVQEYTMCCKNAEEMADFDHIFNAHLKWCGCLACKYFEYCSLDCMFHWNMRMSHADPKSHYCWLKDVYRFMEQEGL